MGAGPGNSKKEKVLVVESARSLAQSAARRLRSEGDEVVVVGSIAEARGAGNGFDRGIFAFDLPDGNGIVLAAEMLLESVVRSVEFFHPDDELMHVHAPPHFSRDGFEQPAAEPARCVA